MSNRNQHAPVFKAEVTLEVLKGEETAAELANRFGVQEHVPLRYPTTDWTTRANHALVGSCPITSGSPRYRGQRPADPYPEETRTCPTPSRPRSRPSAVC